MEGFCVLRIDPEACIDRIAPIPEPAVSNVRFAGAQLGTLYVTTSRMNVPEAELRCHPLQASRLCLNSGVTRLEKHAFADYACRLVIIWLKF